MLALPSGAQQLQVLEDSMPGTSVITNRTGRMKITMGKSILMPALPTSASTRWRRRVRRASA